MLDGKKSTAEKIMYNAFDLMEKRAKSDPVKLFHEALENVRPAVEVRSRRVGGRHLPGFRLKFAPTAVRLWRFRWIVDVARKRSENTMTERLAGEFMDAAQNRGNAVKKREDTHKMAEANKAFSHYRW